MLGILTGRNPLISLAPGPAERGNLLAAAGTGSQILVWDYAQSKIVATLPGPERAGHSLAFSRDGLTIAAGSYDGSVHLWQRSSPKTPDFRPLPGPLVESGAGYALAFNPDGLLAVGREDGSVDLWQIGPGGAAQLLANLSGQHTGVIRSLTFNLAGNLPASGSSDQTAIIWVVK